MDKKQVCILSNEKVGDEDLWIRACNFHIENIQYRVVDLTKNNWLDEILKLPADYLLSKPGGYTAPFKQLYDERIFILEKTLGYKVFPNAEEVFIYENKRFLSFWLKANNIPHPATQVFYFINEALDYLKCCRFPIVAKTNIGASGSGVVILKTSKEAEEYIINTFFGKGSSKKVGLKIRRAKFDRVLHFLINPSELIKKFSYYQSLKNDKQTSFVLFQEYIPHDFEWRVVRIGDSFFAHKKLKVGEMASGSLLKNYDNPPLNLFDFVKDITDRYRLFSQAIDVFPSENGYLVNEMQCIFGQSDPHQMEVNGKMGRYVFRDGMWCFEEGDFNGNESYNLRIQYILGQVQ